MTLKTVYMQPKYIPVDLFHYTLFWVKYYIYFTFGFFFLLTLHCSFAHSSADVWSVNMWLAYANIIAFYLGSVWNENECITLVFGGIALLLNKLLLMQQ